MSKYVDRLDSIRGSRRTVLAWGLLCGAFLGACSSGEDRVAMVGGGSRSRGQVPVGQICQDGAERACGVTHKERDGIVTCYSGTQECTDGTWGECENGMLRTMALPSSGG